jgi:ABC-2 type transport system ATP-binding protein
MRRLILQLNRERGLTVVVASHLLSEIEEMCDRIAILNQGRVLFTGRLSESAEEPRFRIVVDDWERASTVMGSMGATPVFPDTVTLPPAADIAELVAALVRAGVRVRSVEPKTPKLADLYRRILTVAPADV